MTEGQRHRLFDELSDLLGKLRRLEEYMRTVGFGQLPLEDRDDLDQQMYYMRAYGRVLASRVSRYIDLPIE